MSEEIFEGCSGNCAGCAGGCESEVTPSRISLTLQDDTELICTVVGTFSAPNGRNYIALLPLDKDGRNTDGEVYLYRFQQKEDGQPDLDNIETEEEYEIAADAFDELMDTQ